MKTEKQLDCFLKFAASGAATFERELAVINQNWTRTPLGKSDVYIGQAYACHNCVDRDGDRFTSELLEEFRKSAPGKVLLWSHDWDDKDDLIGLVYDAYFFDEPIDQARTRTNELLIQPDGTNTVRWLILKYYIPTIIKDNTDIVAKIEAGVIRYVSVGYSGKWQSATDELGNHRYWDIIPPGAIRELSFVYLGAQPGAAVKKSILNDKKENTLSPQIKIVLGLPPDADEKQITDTIQRLKAVLDVFAINTLEAAQELKSAAEVGRKYRDELVKSLVAAQVKCGRIGSDAAAREAQEAHLLKLPVEKLIDEKTFYEKQVNEQFPEGQKVTGSDPARQGSGVTTLHEAALKYQEEHKKVDYVTAINMVAQKNPSLLASYYQTALEGK